MTADQERAELRAELAHMRSENLRKIEDGLDCSDALLEALERADKAESEVERLRDTNARLNRRAQVAESAINALVSANPAKGRASNVAREVWERCMESHAKAFHRHEAAARAEKAEAIVARVEALADEWRRRGRSTLTWGVSARGIEREIRAALKGETP